MTGFQIDRTALCDAAGICGGILTGSLVGAIIYIIAILYWGV